MSSRPIDSPPPYHPGSDYKPSSYAPSRQMYNGDGRNVYKGSRDGLHNGDMLSHRTYSYFPPDEVHCETQHFYKWSSPPGVIKILLILSIVMCVGIFACVASTLPWDLNDYNGLAMGIGGLGYGSMYGSGVSGFGGNIAGGYGSSSYGYGYGGLGGNYTDPRAAKGFILAVVALCFIFCLVLFVITVSRSQSPSFQTRKFYLIVIIVCAILAFLLLVATIVYIVAVNPTAQAAGTTFYNQLLAICGQFNSPAAAGMLTNLYLYHYCVVDPQEAIAIVLGFLVVIALVIIIYFAAKIRSTIGQYGKMNIIWDKPEQENPNVEDWVNNVSADPYEIPEVLSYPEKDCYPASEGYPPDERTEVPSRVNGTPRVPETEIPLREYRESPQKAYSDSDTKSAQRRPRNQRLKDKKQNTDGCDTDYNTGAESCDELDSEDLDSKYPQITSDQQRQAYKQEFDSDLQEYKQLQAAMDEINKSMSALDNRLDHLTEGSSEYQAAAEEYNRLKDIKASADYKNKKHHCKELKTKLAHIKQKVSDYDSLRS